MSDPEITRTIELVRQAQDGDEAALNRLIQRYYERVRRVVRLRMGAKLRLRVESGDIVQQAFAVAVRKFDRFEMRSEASLINWLSKLAERKITDEVDKLNADKRAIDKEVPLDSGTGDGGTSDFDRQIADTATGPVGKLMRSEDQELLERCIRGLDEQYRRLIELRDYIGYSWAEIAELTGRPSEAAARMMHATATMELAKLVRRARREAGDSKTGA